MDRFKRVMLFLLGGALLGQVLSTLIAQGYLPWDNTPAVGSALCNCTDVTRDTIMKVVRWQLVGAAIGAVAGLIVGLLLSRRKRPPAASGGAGTTAGELTGGASTPSTPAI